MPYVCQKKKMKKNTYLFLLLLLLPFVSSAQRYFTIGTEIDVRNALIGGTVNDRAYNGFHTIGYSAEKFRVEVFYDHFEVIDYESFGMQFGGLLPYNDFRIPILAQISTIHRPNSLTPSLGLVSGVEYHIGRLIIGLTGEGKLRSEFEKLYDKPNRIVFSGRFGVKFKI